MIWFLWEIAFSCVYVCSLQEIAKIVINAICTLISRTKYRGARSWESEYNLSAQKPQIVIGFNQELIKTLQYQFNVKLWFLFVCLEFWSYSRIFHSFLDFGIMILYPYLFDLKNTLSLFTVVRKRTDVPNFEVTGLSIMYAINIPQKVLFLLM